MCDSSRQISRTIKYWTLDLNSSALLAPSLLLKDSCSHLQSILQLRVGIKPPLRLPFVVSGGTVSNLSVGKRQQPVSVNKYSHPNLRQRLEVRVYVFFFLCACVHVCKFVFPNLKRTQVQKWFGLSPPFSRCKSLTTALFNHPPISSPSLYVSQK